MLNMATSLSPTKRDIEYWAKYDFTDTSTMWQESTKNNQVSSNGDSIGYVEDISGNGRDIHQTTSSARPTWNSTYGYDGGSGDYLINTSSVSLSQPFMVGAAFRYTTSFAPVLASFNINTTGAAVYVNSPLFPPITIRIGGVGANDSTLTGTISDNTDYYMVGVFDGSSSLLNLDGNEVDNGTISTLGINRISVGGITSSNSYVDYIKKLAIVEGNNSFKISKLESWLNS